MMIDQLIYQTSSIWKNFGVELHLSKTCEIEKDHLVDKTTQQAEQIRKSIRNRHSRKSIIFNAMTHWNHKINFL